MAKQESGKLELRELRSIVEYSFSKDRENNDYYNDMRNFLYVNTLSDDLVSFYKDKLTGGLSFNIMEAFVSRMKGEFSRQTPTISITQSLQGKATPQQLEFCEDYIRWVFDSASMKGWSDETYDRMLSGGKAVWKIKTSYEDELSFFQNIQIENVYSPTLCGFDDAAKGLHKEDGRYCYEMYLVKVDDLENFNIDVNPSELNFQDYNANAFQWCFINEDQKYVVVCDMYTKAKRKIKIVQLPDGSSMDEDTYKEMATDENWHDPIKNPKHFYKDIPTVSDTREGYKTIIYRTRFIKDKIISFEETDYTYFPLIYIDGNSVKIGKSGSSEMKEKIRAYHHQAQGAQKLKDLAGNKLYESVDKLSSLRFMVSIESLPKDRPELLEAYYEDKVPTNAIVYNDYDPTRPTVKLTPPTVIPPMELPQSVITAFTAPDNLIQLILGSYDSALGINNNQLSGIAIQEGATQSNATAMPYINKYILALNHAATVILDLMPKYLKQNRRIDTLNKDGKKNTVIVNNPADANSVSTNFDPRRMKAIIRSEVNFEVQNARTVQILKDTAATSPQFASFLFSQQGLPFYFDCLDIKDKNKLMEAMQQFFAQMQQQQAQQAQQQQQAMMMSAPMLKAQQHAADLQFKIHNAAVDHQLRADELQVQQEANQNNSNKISLEAHSKGIKHGLELARMNNDMANQRVKNALDVAELKHQQNIDTSREVREHHQNMNDTLDKLNKIE